MTRFGREEIALKEMFGSWQASFQMLFNWRAEVLKRSPGSVIEIDVQEVDGEFHFRRMFCALRPCIDGFLEGCRPYLAIDSTALHGRWNGHLGAGTAIDGHNWMYPLAFGFIDGETTDNWTWFTVKDVFPQAEQRECFRHLMQNFIKRFGGDIFFKNVSCSKNI